MRACFLSVACTCLNNTHKNHDHYGYHQTRYHGDDQEYERAVIFRLGRVKKKGAVGPGLSKKQKKLNQVYLKKIKPGVSKKKTNFKPGVSEKN